MATNNKIAKTKATLEHVLKNISTPEMIGAALESGMIKSTEILNMLQQQLPNQTPTL